MPDMGLPLAYGAGAGADTLEQILKDRFFLQELARKQAEDAAQAQYQQGMLGLAQNRDRREGTLFDVQLPRERVETDVAQQTAQPRILRATKEAERAGTEADRSALGLREDQADAAALTPEGRRVRAAPQAWQPFMPMPGGKSPDQINYEQAMELARQAGRNAVAASGGQAPEPRILSPRKIITPDGRNITLVEAIDPRTGQTVWRKEEASPKTADITNRAEFIRQFSQQLPRLKQISLGGAGVGPQSSGLNVGSGPGQVLRGVTNWAKAQAQWQDDANEYDNALNGLAFLAARVMGSNSQLSDAERNAARSLFPSLRDSKEVAQRKWAYWERIRLASESGDPNAYAAARADVRAKLAGVGVRLDVDQQNEETLSIPTTGVTIAPGGYASPGSVRW